MTDLDSETFAELQKALKCVITDKEPIIEVKTKKTRGRKPKQQTLKKEKENYSMHALKLKAKAEQEKELIINSLNKLIQYFDEMEFEN